ncbi:ATP-binding cassette domain-containing protein [Enterococcus sp. AZ072]|uniref:ATP-binding cassette domain-containing protein n=1 Tax=unclassified Enterococcus TaxID=2608891 RepID=UPI003D282B2C
MRQLLLKNVSYSTNRPAIELIHQLNAEFLPGKVYLILGNAQSGKTTLLSLLAGLMTCSEGTITFDGQDLAEMNRDDYRAGKVSCLFQSGMLVKDTPLANLALEAIIAQQEVSTSELNRVLQQVGLTPVQIKTAVHKLDKKTQQLVSLAKLMVSKSPLVLLDEPAQLFSELNLEETLDELSDFCRKHKKCLIIASQSKNTVKFADELWGLNGGKLLFIKEQQVIKKGGVR